jgi:rhodanese-related sulfurtransferase
MNEETQTILQKENLTAGELIRLLDLRKENKADFVLIDIREDFEIANGFIEGADFFYPTSTFADHLPELEKLKDTHIVFNCRSGARTASVLSHLKQNGFSKVSHLANGIMSYPGAITK